ncbi:MAG: hypothetical protein HYV16_05420 [Gammaproteobacteria bacterium]|nr:hypothetical protein [Gammaproteobacteria bacterium]
MRRLFAPLIAPWPLVLLHGLALPALLTAFATGISLARAQTSFLPAPALFAASGSTPTWHLALGGIWPLLILGIRHTRQNRPRRRLTGLLQLALLGLLLSGLGQCLWPAPGLRLVHGGLAWAAIVLASAHGLSRVWTRGGFQALRLALSPRGLSRYRLGGGLLVLLLAGLWFLAPLAPARFPIALPVQPIDRDQAPNLDGLGDDPVWQAAAPISVTTLDGLRAVPVEVRALSNGATAFFRFRWPDATRSGVHLPLVKRADGWHVLGAGFGQDDERRYYEDKFAIMLADTGEAGGLASLALGAAPLDCLPGSRHGRGLHRAPEGKLLDLWHWKSVRNHGTGNLDDSHLGAPAAPQLGETRYTAGYRADPKDAGGHADNWAWFADGPVQPLRLPRDPAALAPFLALPEPDAPGDSGAWGLNWEETRPYTASQDAYPVGTFMPSVLWRGHNEGDRGDVRAAGQWSDGWWTLELARGLKARSPFDLPLKHGLWLWVAAFDHAQTRHSIHLRPLRLDFGGEARP